MFRKTFLILLSVFASGNLFSQITPQEAVLNMGRGINMGNTLEAPTEGAWAPRAQEYFFDDYKSAGFKTVRIPVRWYPYTDETAPYAISETWMNRVETIVDWALERDFFVIINAHHSSPIKEDYEGQKARWDSIWSQISVRFKDKSEKLFFEMMNEPHGWTQAQVNDYNPRILSIIRKTNPTRIVIFSGNEWTAAEQLITPQLTIPDDDYLMGYYHSYNPWSFGGQGQGTWGTASDKNAITATFKKVAAWSEQNNIPVLLGEFGATTDKEGSNESSDLNSRYRHYASYVENAILYGIAFTVWDDSGWFKVYKRDSRQWEETKDILIHYSPQSPSNFTATIQEDANVLLKWTNQAKSSDSITVQRKRASSTYENVESISGESTQYIDSTLINGYEYHYRLIVHQKDTADSYSYPQWLLSKAPVRSYFKGEPFKVPGTIEAEEFDEGIEGLTYHDLTPGNQSSAFRTDVDVDIQTRNEGGFHIAYIDSGEWLEYSILIEKSATYDITAHVASMVTGSSFNITFEKGPTRLFQVPATGSWQNTKEITQSARLPAGEQIMRIQMLKGPFNLDKIVFMGEGLAITSQTQSPLKIYPNPVSKTLKIESSSFLFSDIEILNIHGQSVFKTACAPSSSYFITLNNKLGNGIYYLKCSHEQDQFTQLFIVNH